ncbi:MAG: tRNA uridine-5-carboxymethylaminomethyl(34) synthesis GTPase MnmE [Gammaproteobacteria bacterium]
MPTHAARTTDTIAAVATPPGRGGIGVVRISGPDVARIAAALFGEQLRPREARLKIFRGADGLELDRGLALFFPAPHSFTGEDVLELHAHGGPVVLALLLERVCTLGARRAGPGEFTKRAYLNGKLDLAQAEAIADLIDSTSEQAARSALRSLRGEFSAQVRGLCDALIELRAYVEAAIDFPDEELDFLGDGKIAARLRDIEARFQGLHTAATQGSLLREGLTLALAGRPNAGKSSLLNRLAGHAAAIVTDVPGTTRDVLREYINLDGLPLHVVDTAGLREVVDVVEREGVRRAWDAARSADRVLFVVDDVVGLSAADRRILTQLPAKLPVTLVYNKIDLSGRAPGQDSGSTPESVSVSAKTGVGLDALREHLKQVAGFQAMGEGSFMARRRHLGALARTEQHLELAAQRLRERSGELLAEELRIAQRALGEITGEFTSEDLLAKIFSSFCIGK